MTTHEELLKEGRAYLRNTSESWQLDAELLLAHALRIPREQLIAHHDASVPFGKIARYRTLLQERYKGTPLPYLTGQSEFYARQFIITKHVLVPRPETEAIIEQAIHWHTSQNSPILAADIGTGSGILAVTLAKELPDIRVIASDRSSRALAVARRNARKHRVLSRITFTQGDLLRNISSIPTLLVANLPYVPTDELAAAGDSNPTRGLTFEPQSALNGGPDGMFIFRRLASQISSSPALSSSLECIILEHAPHQRTMLNDMIQHALLAPLPHRAATPYVTVWRK